MKTFKACAIAFLSMTAALLLTLAIPPARDKSPYLLLALAVMVGATQGWQAGIFATLLGAAYGIHFLIPPLNVFAISGPEDAVPLLLFGAVGLSITSIFHRLQLSKNKIRSANDTLAEAHRKLTVLLDSLSDGFTAIDLEGRYTFVNPASLRILGKTPEELLGKSIFDVWPGFEASAFGAAYRRAESESVPVQIEDFYGEPLNLWIQARFYPSPEGLSVFFTDVSERKRADEERHRLTRTLADRVEELQAILDSAPVAIWIAHDPHCLRITGNAYSYQMIMRLPYDTNVSLSAPPDARVASYKMCREGVELRLHELPAQVATATGKPVMQQKLDMVFPDGRTVHMLMGAVPLFDAAGGVRGAVAFGVDMTKLREAEERWQRSQKLESISMLAGGIAHDFNNLLVSVIGNASLAQSMFPDSHPVVEILARIIRAGDQAAILTRQMLAYAGKGRYVVELLDLSRLIRDLIAELQPSISKRIKLHLELAADLPPVEADRDQIQQVFMNLVLNAAEAIGNDAGRITLKTSVRSVDYHSIRQFLEAAELHPGKYVCLEVSDNGSGMDSATVPKIFDPFFSTKFTGRGLGLAAVAGIVRGHKGAIRVDSTPGEGSCFTVLLPTVQERVEDAGGR